MQPNILNCLYILLATTAFVCVAHKKHFHQTCEDQSSCFDCVRFTNIEGVLQNCQWCASKNLCTVSTKIPKNCVSNNATVHGTCDDIPIFDPQLARRFFDFAAAADLNSPQDCLANAQPDFTVHKLYSVPCDLSNDCYGFVAISHVAEVIVIAFSGTRTKTQFRSEIIQGATYSMERFPTRRHSYGHVLSYFKRAHNKFWTTGLKDDVEKLTNSYPNYQVWVTGHSLGAALASMMSVNLVNDGTEDQQVVSDARKLTSIVFGLPRLGDCLYANAHDAYVKTSFRVVHAMDIVANLPPSFYNMCRKHIPRHHGVEVFYPGNMSSTDDYKICTGLPLNEDHTCSNNGQPHNMQDHFWYYNMNITDYLLNGCRQQTNSTPPHLINAIQKTSSFNSNVASDNLQGLMASAIIVATGVVAFGLLTFFLRKFSTNGMNFGNRAKYQRIDN